MKGDESKSNANLDERRDNQDQWNAAGGVLLYRVGCVITRRHRINLSVHTNKNDDCQDCSTELKPRQS